MTKYWELLKSGDDAPWPCIWPGCMEPAVDTASLCAAHELVYIARAGHRSPYASTIVEWNNALHDRTKWLFPIMKEKQHDTADQARR